MNKLQADLSLLCATMCWSSEVIIYAAIPNSVPNFATTAITNAIGAFILFIAFYNRIATALQN